MPKIKFEYDSEFANVTDNPPSPASRFLPKWLKDLHRYPSKKIEPNGLGGVSQTVKACPPFLDAMMVGYIITTEFDLLVTQDENEQKIEWQSGGSLVGTHGKSQIAKEQIPDGYSNQPWKFNNFYRIKTPKGYSTMFMHPVNRDDLPFRTLSGIVDTDLYNLQVNFPFLLKDDFQGIIPAGTPIVQLVPIKRESWTSSIGQIAKETIDAAQRVLAHKMIAAYKTMFWQRKDYK